MSTPVTTTVSYIEETLLTYADAVKRGDYDTHVGNLIGKHDNVRSYWEDQLTRLTIRPYLTDLVARKRAAEQKVRIVDLGCGAGQGYELLTRIDQPDLDLGLYHQRVLETNDLACYLGIDISESMVNHGNELYAANPAMHFVQGDLNDGLAAVADEKPFDLYFCAYGSLSHLETTSLQSLLNDVVMHAADGSIVVMDLLGRNSLEWPDYWIVENDADKYRDYSMSYLHRDVYNRVPEAVEIEHFPMRFWTGDEIDELVQGVNRQHRGGLHNGSHANGESSLNVLQKFDRSIFVSRHIDTKEYNSNLKPIRRVVNQLHQDYMRTDLEQLLWEPGQIPMHSDPRVNNFFQQLMTSWNRVIQFTQARLHGNISLVHTTEWDTLPGPLQFALMTMDRVINNAEWMWFGDPRANIIEPQLGYTLRSLERNLQRGLGCGHGFLVILEVST